MSWNSSSALIVVAGFLIVGLSQATLAAESGEIDTNSYVIYLDTRSNFDEISFGDKLRYVFRRFTTVSEHHILSADDILVMQEANRMNPRPDRAIGLWKEGCEYFQQVKMAGGEPDIEFLAQVVVTGEQYEIEANHQPYLAGYELLSPRGKEWVLAEIESMRGTLNMGQARMDFARWWDDQPEAAISYYEKFCANLPEIINRYDNPAERNVPPPILKDIIPIGDFGDLPSPKYSPDGRRLEWWETEDRN